MVVFPNAKINLGLYVTARRPDGYHEIETVMVPVDWHDILVTVGDLDLADDLYLGAGTGCIHHPDGHRTPR